MTILIRHPFTALVAGATGSGKTVLVRNLLQHHKYIIDDSFSEPKVLWCYGINQSLYQQIIPNVYIEYYEGLASEEYMRGFDIVVVDDLMSEKSSDQGLANLFTRGSHHLNISVIFIVQNLFEKGMRTISLNAHYIFLMKNPRDKSQILAFGRQVFPGKSNYFRESYDDATSTRFGYLLVDLSHHCDDEYRLRTNLLPISGIVRQTVYIPK